jgi:guanylate kinase
MERNPLQEKRSRGRLFIVSAPSGAGKTTLCRSVVASLPHLKFSVSYTTRQPRPGETPGADYSFINRGDFQSMIDRGEFIEWAEVHGERYGTSRQRLHEMIRSGYDVILDIDTQGAMQIKEKHSEGTYVFVMPPSMEVLRQRLRSRMTDSLQEIDKRLNRSVAEIKTYPAYDYVIINDTLNKAVREFEAIILSYRARTEMINPLWVEERFFKQEES